VLFYRNAGFGLLPYNLTTDSEALPSIITLNLFPGLPTMFLIG